MLNVKYELSNVKIESWINVINPKRIYPYLVL